MAIVFLKQFLDVTQAIEEGRLGMGCSVVCVGCCLCSALG